MQFQLLIVLLFSIIYAVYAMIECPANICETVDCANADKADCEGARDGIFAEHGGFCGCCSTCLRKLREGENCQITLLIGSVPTAACDKGLVCKPGVVIEPSVHHICTKQ